MWSEYNANTTGNTVQKLSVSELLAAEQALTYEERVRKALNLKPYLNYLNDLFAQKLSDTSDSEDDNELSNSTVQTSYEAEFRRAEDSKCPGITQAIRTLNLNLCETISLSPSLAEVTGKLEICPSGVLGGYQLPSASPFSPHSSYSSSIPGLSPDVSDNEKHEGPEGSELTPISDIELHKYLERPVVGLSSSPDEDIISLLSSTNSDFKPQRKRKWDNRKSEALQAEVKPISPSVGCSNSIGGMKHELNSAEGFTTSVDLAAEDILLAGMRIDVTEVKESTLKIKEDPDKLLTESYDDFHACMKNSNSHDKLNLNQTADFEREDKEEECQDGDDGKGNVGMEDEDDDSLSDYMNITANSALALDTYFKFDPDELTSAAQSPLSPSSTPSLPSLATIMNAIEVEDSSSESLGRKAKKISLQKQARIVQILNIKRRRIYVHICKKEVFKAARVRTDSHKEMLIHTKRLALMCSRHLRQEAMQSQSTMKEAEWRAKRLTREMQTMWKQTDRTKRENKRRKDKEVEEQKRLDMELNDAKEQRWKLNIMITQKEVFAHFMIKKLNGTNHTSIDEKLLMNYLEGQKSVLLNCENKYDSEAMKRTIIKSVKTGFEYQRTHIQEYSIDLPLFSGSECEDEADAGADGSLEISQPRMFTGTLKQYQRQGLAWLVNLFNHGANGILADEAGLGKTVQSLALLAHIAESDRIWGPFIIVTPTSAIYNWQQEIENWVPDFILTFYTGNSQERKILREGWQQNINFLGTERADFHIVITTYQIMTTDLKYLNRIKWQYSVLDEAQSIKTGTTSRWRSLLGLNCRSRLLLTGTPILNSFNELWNLSHFLLPSLFDSNEDFNDWTMKNIGSHTDNRSFIEDKDLIRMKQIVKPFMLRRMKKDVEKEFPEKVEIMISCPLSARQRLLYSTIQQNFKIEDLVKSSLNSYLAQQESTNLMNLVSQLRNVCNHPDLCETRVVQSPFYMSKKWELYPSLLFYDGLLYDRMNHFMENRFSIYNPVHIRSSLLRRRTSSSSWVEDLEVSRIHCDSAWSFTRFIELSPLELFNLMYGGLVSRWSYILKMYKVYESLYRRRFWNVPDEEDNSSKLLTSHDFFLYPNSVTSFPCIENSEVLVRLIFTSPSSPIYALLDEKIVSLSHSQQVQKVFIRPLVPTYLPRFLSQSSPKVSSAGRLLTSWKLKYDTEETMNEVFPSFIKTGVVEEVRKHNFYLNKIGGLEASEPQNGWSNIILPDKHHLITDSGKLSALDDLLKDLQINGHRVIMYTHITNMLDILEEYLDYRKLNFIRLDISSNVTEMRNLVTEFHLRTEVFILLLATGTPDLGIKLTAADTVIFYDSDWNPAIDQQALDQVHCLGQTKKVSVYRLFCEESIEQRILRRNSERSEVVQRRMKRREVFGSEFVLRPIELVSLLLDEDDLKTQFQLDVNTVLEDNYAEYSKVSTSKRKANIGGIQNKILKEKPSLARKLRSTEVEPGSSVCSSVSITGSSPANSDLCVGEDNNTDLPDEDAEFESEEEEELESVFPLQDIDCVDGQFSLTSRRFNSSVAEWNIGSTSDFEEDLGAVPNRPKVGRGGGRRGRPPTRVRVVSRDPDGSRRGRPVGRPRLKRIGPLNQGVRGRRPGRPPLTKKAEGLTSSSLTLTTSQSIFGFYSSPGMDPT